jgi:hypothetical protein
MMRKALLSLAVLLAMTLPAWAAIEMSIPDLTIPYTATSASFIVEAAFTGSYDMDSYELEIDLTPQGTASGVTFNGSDEAASNYIFDDPLGWTDTDPSVTRIYGDDGANVTPETKTDVTKNLIRVDLAAALTAADIGDTYIVSFGDLSEMYILSGGSLQAVTDDDWSDTGTITISDIPEPGAMTMLLGLGVCGLILYRRRRKRA